jgi:hypothetical protein
LGVGSSIKGDFTYGVNMETEYNSNFFLTDGDEESELSAFIAPWITYGSDPEGGAMATFIANYRPTLRFYNDNSDLNVVDQGGDFVLGFSGSRTEISIFGRYSELSGTDQLSGDFVNGRLFTGGIRGSRQIAPRTSLFGELSAAMSDYESSLDEGSEIYRARFGGLWESSERLSVGSSLRYTLTESNNTGTLNAWALLGEMRYQLGDRIWLEASIGPEFSSSSQAGSSDSVSLTGQIIGRYIIDERWSVSGTIRDATVPSPNAENNLVNSLGVNAAVQRALTRGYLRSGIDYRFSDYESVGLVSDEVSDEHNLSAFIGYERNFFKDRLKARSMIRYSINDGDDDWSQVLVTLGLDVHF